MSTLTSLKKKRTRLTEQLAETEREIAALEAVPTQGDLAGIPLSPPVARKPSVHEENFAEFQGTRRTRLERLGVDYVPDERLQPAFVNARLKHIRDACRDDDELFALFTRYVAEDYWARCTPPFPFTAFAADKTWKRLLAEQRGEPPPAGTSFVAAGNRRAH